MQHAQRLICTCQTIAKRANGQWKIYPFMQEIKLQAAKKVTCEPMGTGPSVAQELIRDTFSSAGMEDTFGVVRGNTQSYPGTDG